MSSTIQFKTDVKLTVNQLIEITAQLSEKDRKKMERALLKIEREAFKAKLKNDLKEAFEEVRLYREGKIQLRTAEEFLNEL